MPGSGDAGRYDALGDAERLAEPLRRWASVGFMRGFVGVRKDMASAGVRLPSAVFSEVAEGAMGDGGDADGRRRYVDEVVDHLSHIQAEAMHRHYEWYLRGVTVDIAVSVVLLALIGAGIHVFGVMSPVTGIMLLLICLKLLVVRFTTIYMMKTAEAALRFKAEDVRLPWATPQM